jgi:hypothetical protein
MILMGVVGLVFVVGTVLVLRWAGTGYQGWDPDPSGDDLRPSVRTTVLRYLRGVAIFLVAGFWAGLLVTGPAIRLIMRLLAVTAGDDAQGRITEADEVVGSINVDGTIALILFGGVLTGLLSAAIYVVCRRLLPGGRLTGVTFGVLHLVIAATRLDPLRPDNEDFDLVGPGWLAVATFGLAAVLHGIAVVAFANRYSRALPARSHSRADRAWAIAPLVLPALLLIPGVALLVGLIGGLVLTVAASRIAPLVRFARSRTLVVAGRVAVGVTALLLLPGAVTDIRDVIDRDDAPFASPDDR